MPPVYTGSSTFFAISPLQFQPALTRRGLTPPSHRFKHQALDHAVHGINCEMIRYFQHDGSYITGENDSAFQHPRYRWAPASHMPACLSACCSCCVLQARSLEIIHRRPPPFDWTLLSFHQTLPPHTINSAATRLILGWHSAPGLS